MYIIQIIGACFIVSLLYVWCHKNASQIVSFWFGMQFPVILFSNIKRVLISCAV